MKKINVVSFFSGCGGFDYGFHKNKKFNVIFANDNWKDACESFKLNYNKTPIIERKIEELNKSEIKKLLNDKKVDVVIGGPPCQCFTRLNNNKLIKDIEGKKEDKRRKLVFEYIKKIKILQPRIILMENVRDLVSRKNHEGKFYHDVICEKFEKIGYKTYYKIIEMDKYGVPQKRKRIIFLATNEDEIIKNLEHDNLTGFPNKLNKIISVEEGLVVLKNIKNLENNEVVINDDKVLERIRNIPQGGYYNNLPDNLKTKGIRNGKEVIVKRYGSYFRRLHPKKPATTITNNYIIHPCEDRYLTNREKAVLHSFPKDYKFYGSSCSVSQQIANAVPPKFSELMAEKISKILS
jgi:DNA (cytosine-5)-methyltransferase 1